jgi:hypothetical protein
MSALTQDLTGLQIEKINSVVQAFYDAGEHDYTIRALAITLRSIIDMGREATGTPREATIFGNPADLEWDGD